MNPASLSIGAPAFYDEKDVKAAIALTQKPVKASWDEIIIFFQKNIKNALSVAWDVGSFVLSQAKPHSETFKNHVRRFNSSLIKTMEVHHT